MAFRLFSPILAGATLRERVLACFGAFVGIALAGAVCGLALGVDRLHPLIVAPIGASAVLLFAVPASPLAQPWPIIGGNTISALVGMAVAHVVGDPTLAIGLAVALSIAIMSLTRSLHPPGGAAALTAALGGPVVEHAGWLFAFVPVALNSILLVGVGIVFHRLARRNYPHVAVPAASTHGTADPPTQLRSGFQPGDIDAALEALHETFDIDRADLQRLFRQVEYQALARNSGTLLCRDIMSRDVVQVDVDADVDVARALLLEHNIRSLPVIDAAGRLAGTVGLRELADARGRVGDVLSRAATPSASAPAMSLLPALTDGRTHAVILVDDAGRIEGLITQTDLLAATARLAVATAR
ncbi:CBS domain-containing protein (plasmid) [Mesorhizobium sp. NBSH29]|uniref:HPP family protein n=1 Tax=Mesorhizobium sp. NBSH29 TaxID=2654249 RepID=UPI0018963FC7|nr:HPP family protein [Mesorhizobium sp. NBSH29]QPC89022.1 CBS domain-containing protein [Mesorhizobium sp. NBSH29]